ncbi:RDH13-like protein [Mya arenaria]|uniref:RDH13-like protein n=1 Tax=Mya arenaria TaxID=6604 RepID=A0ABY7FFY1_MYAAR|nr:RDH13-like protein [Mya arenaria]
MPAGRPGMEGARVIMACRNIDACTAAREEIYDETINPSLECRELNLASSQSIRKFVDQIKREKRNVDVLINNAGTMCGPRDTTNDGFEWQLGVNYLGPFLLTLLLLDKLKASPQGRIINVVSPFFKKSEINFDDLNSVETYQPKIAYGQSKLALVLFSQELARRLEGTKVTVNCVNPGVCKTSISRHLPVSQSMLGGLVTPILWVFCKSAFQGAQTPVFLAVDTSLDKTTGKYFSDMKEDKLSENALDEKVAQRLWMISEKWTKLNTSL